MSLTKKYKNDVEKAIRCAETGKAYHWPTIAAILADEIKRMRGTHNHPVDKIELLRKIADQDNCDGDCDLEYPHKRCQECEARSALNEIGEIARNALGSSS